MYKVVLIYWCDDTLQVLTTSILCVGISTSSHSWLDTGTQLLVVMTSSWLVQLAGAW